MTLPEVITVLETHNKWRLGDNDLKPTKPKELTEALEIAINLLKQLK